MPDCIEIEKVTKAYKNKVAVSELSLSIPRGCIQGVIGPNGSGKTTTLRLILGIIPPDSGIVRLFGKPARAPAGALVGYLPEERGLYRNMTVREQIRYYGQLKGATGLERSINEWLERLDLTRWADRKLDTLSKGMSQKVQFIAAVIARPPLLILDEPFSGLDPLNMEWMRQAILELNDGQRCILLSTHDMAMAERMCQRIFMIHDGKKVLDGTLDEIRSGHSRNHIRIRPETPGQVRWSDWDEVESSTDYGQESLLRLKAACDPHAVMRRIVESCRVQSCSIEQPDLHDLFIGIAGKPTTPARNINDTSSIS
jgi:ABC-2 type transport system ATP-binding protein